MGTNKLVTWTMTKDQVLPVRLNVEGVWSPDRPLPGTWRSSKPAVATVVPAKERDAVKVVAHRLGRTLITFRPAPEITTATPRTRMWVQVVRKRP